ncbi:YitT family protein [Leuconostoc gelidum subsp. aenigmaticum]|uniref:YitT family protein n=1 Tax=Leuconostoc gelidum TaxID=1244 RepID=UPI001C7D7912|nr:YitT family protein [Leuconostoc gelidum]MBZ6002987.1 YitT family protein [Leuconostoc gelidum subsp. aenigmaticum]MBZ6010673.1 YitT family protein [Leuconostoc gelidum subsp. aenigmaticum]
MKKFTINWRKVLLIAVVFLASTAVQVLALNAFLIPNKVFSSGFNGIAQLLSIFFVQLFHINMQTGTFIMIFNIPIGIIGWKLIGGKFTILSFLNSIVVSVVQIVAPTQALTTDPLLASLFGGLLLGVSIGLAMRYGFSTGGMDIVALVVQKRTGKSIGVLMNGINFVVVIVAGAFIGWQNALFTLIGIYATGRAVDALYTGYQKLTALIVTSNGDEVVEALHRDLIRGITILPSRGAYTKRDSMTLMMVLSRYELVEMQEIVHRTDPKAFINLLSTVSVSGEFFDADRQLQMRRAVTVPKLETVTAQIEAEQQLESQLDKLEADDNK